MSNLNLLHIFWEVAKTKNITRASENLFVSQPAVSSSIKELERIYGKQLFIRKNKGIELNYFGEKLFNQIDLSMKNLANIDSKISMFDKQQKGYIRIATNTSNLNKLITDEMTKFIKDFPETEL
ncbi:MAG: LysR family transcriptional regulator, partial [Clostridia bacterium]|nr:LysR family transcriptional regulator [Clostridia bacterium]